MCSSVPFEYDGSGTVHRLCAAFVKQGVITDTEEDGDGVDTEN